MPPKNENKIVEGTTQVYVPPKTHGNALTPTGCTNCNMSGCSRFCAPPQPPQIERATGRTYETSK